MREIPASIGLQTKPLLSDGWMGRVDRGGSARDQRDRARTRYALKAGEVLRSLVKEIVLTPKGGDLKIDVRGDLAGILAVLYGS